MPLGYVITGNSALFSTLMSVSTISLIYIGIDMIRLEWDSNPCLPSVAYATGGRVNHYTIKPGHC